MRAQRSCLPASSAPIYSTFAITPQCLSMTSTQTFSQRHSFEANLRSEQRQQGRRYSEIGATLIIIRLEEYNFRRPPRSRRSCFCHRSRCSWSSIWCSREAQTLWLTSPSCRRSEATPPASEQPVARYLLMAVAFWWPERHWPPPEALAAMSAAPLNTEAARRTHQRRSHPILLSLAHTTRLSLCLNPDRMAWPVRVANLSRLPNGSWSPGSKRPGTGWGVFIRIC